MESPAELAYIGSMYDPSDPEGSAIDLQQLARRTRAGDRTAFERLHDRLAPGLRRILLRRTHGQADLAEELAQKTWVEVWRALSGGRYDESKAAISTFVYAVAHKLWLRGLRQLRSRPVTGSEFETFAAIASEEADNPAALLHAGELIDALRACLHAVDTPLSLTPEEREAVVRLATGETERSLAEKLGAAPSTIHGRKHAAYKKLRRCLRAKGFSQESAERGGEACE